MRNPERPAPYAGSLEPEQAQFCGNMKKSTFTKSKRGAEHSKRVMPNGNVNRPRLAAALGGSVDSELVKSETDTLDPILAKPKRKAGLPVRAGDCTGIAKPGFTKSQTDCDGSNRPAP